MAQPVRPPRFLHISDTHIGYVQYGLERRAVDIARSLKAALQHAVEEQVDFILIGGDFFERRDTRPDHFQHAVDCLRVPKDAGIPVYAIAGNHDKAYWSRTRSWLDILNDSHMFCLLAPAIDEQGRLRLDPWDENTRTGAVVELPHLGCRIIGIPHLGNHTVAMIPQIAEQLPSDGHQNIVMMHLGLTGQIAGSHDALDKEDLAPLRPKTNYLALGHYHKRYEIDDWIYNPGGTENRSVSELDFEHGYFISTLTKPPTVEFHSGLRRPFHRLQVSIDDQTETAGLHAAIANRLNQMDLADEPLVQVDLVGQRSSNKQKLQVQQIERDLQQSYPVLKIILRSAIDTVQSHTRMNSKSGLDRATLEQDVMSQKLRALFPALPEEECSSRAKEMLGFKHRDEEPEKLWDAAATLSTKLPEADP